MVSPSFMPLELKTCTSFRKEDKSMKLESFLVGIAVGGIILTATNSYIASFWAAACICDIVENW